MEALRPFHQINDKLGISGHKHKSTDHTISRKQSQANFILGYKTKWTESQTSVVLTS